jgi:hypothetical protein
VRRHRSNKLLDNAPLAVSTPHDLKACGNSLAVDLYNGSRAGAFNFLGGLFKWNGRFTGFLSSVERANTLEFFKIVQKFSIFLRCQLKIDLSAALFGPKQWIWHENPLGIVYVAMGGHAMVRFLLFIVYPA